MYLYQLGDKSLFNPSKYQEELPLDLSKVMEYIDSLTEKKLIQVEVIKNEKGLMEEVVLLDGFYRKLTLNMVEEENEKKNHQSNIFEVVEKEFGRTLSPMEYEIIKAWLDNDMSEDLIKEAIKEATFNGVSNLRYIDKILYSYFIGHSTIRTGNKIIHDDVNTIVFGSDKNLNKNVLRLKKFFDNAKINYKIPEDIRHSLWLKYMLNVCANQTTAILRMTFGEMLENKHFMQMAVNIMKEVQAIAKAEGINNTETMIEETLENLSHMIPEGKTSMLQDVEAGRHTEVDMFAGTMIQFGKKHNIPTPYNCMIKEFIDIIHENQDFQKTKIKLSV